MPAIYIDLDEFNDDEMIKELNRRGYTILGRDGKLNYSIKQRDAKEVIESLIDIDCPREIIEQIENHYLVSLVPDEIKLLLKSKTKK